MALWAVCTLRMHVRPIRPTRRKHVLSMRDEDKMCWVNARRSVARVVQLATHGFRPVKHLPYRHMHRQGTAWNPRELDPPVAVTVAIALPRPARIGTRRLIDPLPNRTRDHVGHGSFGGPSRSRHHSSSE